MEENNNVNEPNENIQNGNTEETNQENANENNTTSGEVKEGEVIGNDGFSAKEKEDGKLMAILSYVGVLSLVPYLAEKDNKWVRYHAIQGVNLFIIEVILYIIRMIPILGWIVGWLGSIVTLVISIIGIVNACNGETKELPIVGKIKFIKQ